MSSQLENLIQRTMDTNAATRKGAEDSLKEARGINPNDYVLSFLSLLTDGNPKVEIKQQAYVLLSHTCRTSMTDGFIYDKLDVSTQTEFRKTLINLMRVEGAVTQTREALSMIVSHLCGHICQDDLSKWPELLPATANLYVTSGNNVEHKIMALSVLHEIVDNVPEEAFRIAYSDLMAILEDSLCCNNSAQIQAKGVSLFCCLGSELKASDGRSIQKLGKSFIFAVQQICCNKEFDNEAVACFESLVQVSETNGQFLKPFISELIQIAIRIAVDRDDLFDSTRQIALEFVVSFAENKPVLFAKTKEFTTGAIRACMHFMTQIEDDDDWLTSFDDEDDESEYYDIGLDSIDRLAVTLGGEVVIPIVFQGVKEFGSMGSWKHKVAALMAISQTAEVLEEESQMDEVVYLLSSHLKDDHPRVRFAALHAIGQCSTDLGPYVQSSFPDLIIPALCGCMSDPVPKVRAHACAAFVNYGEQVMKEMMIPYVGPLMHLFTDFLREDQPPKIREQAITAMAVLAGVVEESFAAYYPQVMPIMKHIISSANSEGQRVLRGKAFECISLLGLAVGRDGFREDCKSIMEEIFKMSRSGDFATTDDGDDPLKSFVLEACQRMSRVLGEEFSGYLNVVVPLTLNSMTLENNSVDSSDPDAYKDDMTLTMLSSGKCMGLKTAAIEALTTAAQTFSCLVENVGARHFEPFLPNVAQTTRPLIHYALADEPRRSVLAVWTDLVHCAAAVNSKSICRELLIELTNNLLVTLPDMEDFEGAEVCARGIAESLKKSICCEEGQVLTADEVCAIVDISLQVVKKCFERSDTNRKIAQPEEQDEDDVEKMKEEKESSDSLMIAVTEIGGALMANFRTQLVQCRGLEKYLEIVEHLLPNHNAISNRCLALYVCSDLVDNLKEFSIPYWPLFINAVIESLNDDSGDIRHAAAYTVNLAVRNVQTRTAFSEFLPVCVRALINAANRSDNRKKANHNSHDNIIAALGHVLEAGECVPGSMGDIHLPDSWNLWLRNLPLKSDEEEGLLAHAQLARMFEERRPTLLGTNNSNSSKIIEVLTTVYRNGLGSTNDELDSRIRRLLNSISRQDFESISNQLSSVTKKRIVKILDN